MCHRYDWICAVCLSKPHTVYAWKRIWYELCADGQHMIGQTNQASQTTTTLYTFTFWKCFLCSWVMCVCVCVWFWRSPASGPSMVLLYWVSVCFESIQFFFYLVLHWLPLSFQFCARPFAFHSFCQWVKSAGWRDKERERERDVRSKEKRMNWECVDRPRQVDGSRHLFFCQMPDAFWHRRCACEAMQNSALNGKWIAILLLLLHRVTSKSWCRANESIVNGTRRLVSQCQGKPFGTKHKQRWQVKVRGICMDRSIILYAVAGQAGNSRNGRAVNDRRSVTGLVIGPNETASVELKARCNSSVFYFNEILGIFRWPFLRRLPKNVLQSKKNRK